VRWETLRTRPAAAAGDGNWRTDPAQAGGGILVDHGWHALYALRQWLPGSPRRIAARLEKRESADLPVEDTAEVSLEWDGARAEVFLTWAALERRNRVVVEGDLGTIALDGGRIAVAGPDAAERVLEVPPLTEGSHHPEWFCAVARELDAEIRDASRRGANLAEAVFCAEAIARAYASDREGGAAVPLP
jgi:predicted dehydrogenase